MPRSPFALTLALAVGLASPQALAQSSNQSTVPDSSLFWAADAAPNYSEHVAPILFARCTSCHRAGEVAPFPLLGFADARKRGRMIAKVTRSRFMPPWHPVQGHGEFSGAMRLDEKEIATLAAWVKGGMKEGDPKKAPKPPVFPAGWQLGKPDLVVTMTEGFEVPAGGPDIYRNFVVPMKLDDDKWLTAIEVRPSARNVLHHIIFGMDTRGRGRRLDGQDGKPGYDGMRGGGGRGLGTSTSGLGGWAVGGTPMKLPMDLARKLPAGADLILRSHFHPAGKKETEKTTLGLYFAKKPPTRTMIGLQLPPGFGMAAGLDIKPGEKRFKLEDSFTLPVAALGVTVGGHAHYVCKEMQVFATVPDGKRKSIFFIDDWAFNWQNRYQYKVPVELPAGTKIDMIVTYDNSAENPNNPFDPPRRIRWGLQSTDEMGSVTLLMVAKDESEASELRNAIRRHSRSRMRSGSANRFSGLMISQIKMLDKNGNGKIEAEEMPERTRGWVLRFDEDGDGAISEAELEKAVDNFGRRGRRRRGGDDGDGDDGDGKE